MNAYLDRWRSPLAEPPEVETYRVDTRARTLRVDGDAPP
jgi:hypothetical protein